MRRITAAQASRPAWRAFCLAAWNSGLSTSLRIVLRGRRPVLGVQGDREAGRLLDLLLPSLTIVRIRLTWSSDSLSRSASGGPT